MDELQAYVRSLDLKPDLNDVSQDPYISLRWYPRIWDEWAREKDGAVPDDIYGKQKQTIDVADADTLRFRFPSLLPEFADEFAHHLAPRCANEISFRFYGQREHLAEVFPKSSGTESRRVISGLASSRGEWRAGRNGLVKLVRNDFNEAHDIPRGESVVFAYLADLGWKPKLSPPGTLAKQIYKQLGGDINILSHVELLGLLEHMNGGAVKRDGSPQEDREDKLEVERDLPIGEVKSKLKEYSEWRDLHDHLVEKGVFKLGLRTACPQCLRNSWFPLDAIQDRFTCPKCLNAFPAIGNVDNRSPWSYKTAGPFSVPKYGDGAYAVLLALNFFSDHKMTTMRVTPALSFKAESPTGETLEADFALFWQESLYGEQKSGQLFAECKSFSRFERKDFNRMRSLASRFPGAVLAFCTLRSSLSVKEVREIARIAKKGRKYWKSDQPTNPVLILTANELLTQFGPPECWEEPAKSRFNHLAGLLGVCDATQQIYLGLPSWHEDWHKQFDRKRRRARGVSGQNAQA